uniref:Ubiquitin-like domain-containing protein n=1 Tax=Clytia hemisphaerica TaxID=252671 RepID=A0A7M6DJN6_9CNID|eukprot:TCONS_00069018-protein
MAYCDGDSHFNHTCQKFGIKYIGPLKIRSLTMEDTLTDIPHIDSVVDVKRYIRERQNIPIYRQTLMFQGDSIDNDLEHISSIFLKVDSEKEFIFNLLITNLDQPFDVKIRYTYHINLYAPVTIQISDTVAIIKLKFLEEHNPRLSIRPFGQNLQENIKKYKLDPRPLDCYKLHLGNETLELENNKTAQDYNLDSYSELVLTKSKLIRFHFKNSENVIEKSISIWPGITDAREEYKNFKTTL